MFKNLPSIVKDHAIPLAVGVALVLVGLWSIPAYAQDVPPMIASIPFIGPLLDSVKQWFPVVASVIGTFSMIAALTANETDDKIVNYILKAINFLGFNFGTAKNDAKVGVTKL